MAQNRLLVDANILVRFFTGEPPEMAEKVYRLVEKADRGEVVLVVFPVILLEAFYTLKSYYEMPQKEIAEKLSAFIQSRGVEAVESARLVNALSRCAEKNAHLADAYLAAASVELKNAVSSFDADFKKFKDVERIEPE